MIREDHKLPKDVTKRIPVLIDRMSKDNHVIALFAFGSLATGQLKRFSDLDFGILVSGTLNRQERFDKHLYLMGTFNSVLGTDEVDLVLMNDAPMKFCHEILKTGKLLHCAHTEELVDFSERIIMRYLDFKYFRDNFDETFLEGVGYHG